MDLVPYCSYTLRSASPILGHLWALVKHDLILNMFLLIFFPFKVINILEQTIQSCKLGQLSLHFAPLGQILTLIHFDARRQGVFIAGVKEKEKRGANAEILQWNRGLLWGGDFQMGRPLS